MNAKTIQEYVAQKVVEYLKERDEELEYLKKRLTKFEQQDSKPKITYRDNRGISQYTCNKCCNYHETGGYLEDGSGFYECIECNFIWCVNCDGDEDGMYYFCDCEDESSSTSSTSRTSI